MNFKKMVINFRKYVTMALFLLCMKVKKGYISGQDSKSKKNTKMIAI